MNSSAAKTLKVYTRNNLDDSIKEATVKILNQILANLIDQPEFDEIHLTF